MPSLRVLVTSQPGLGHVNGIIPLAQQLQRSGNAVLVAGSPSVVAAFGRGGIDGVAVVDEPLGSDSARTHSAIPELQAASGPHRLAIIRSELAIKKRAVALLGGLSAVMSSWHPTVVLRDATEFAGWALAERFEIPDISFEVSAHWSRQRWDSEVGDALRDLRQIARIPRLDSPASALYRHMHINNAPSSMRDSSTTLPESTIEIVPEFFENHTGTEIIEAPAGHAYLAFGSVYRPPGQIVRRVVETLTEEVRAVLVAGATQTNFQRVISRPYIPQTPVMETCSVVICHGGRNTVLTALRHGVPVVCAPIASDHFDIAGFAESSGAGLTATWTPEAIVASARRVIREPSFRIAARNVAVQIAAMKDGTDAVGMIEERFA